VRGGTLPKHCPDAVWGTFCKKARNSEKPLFEVKNLPIITHLHCPETKKDKTEVMLV
jgi:hypothetical protein